VKVENKECPTKDAFWVQNQPKKAESCLKAELEAVQKAIWAAPKNTPKGVKRAKDKKLAGSPRQFSHVMGNADQPPLGLDFLQPP
jgi:hypothetical protein